MLVFFRVILILHRLPNQNTVHLSPNRFNSISKIFSAVSRSSSFFATSHFSAVPSKFLGITVHACLSSFNLSYSRYSLTTSTLASIQPSELLLNSLGFLKVFRDFPLSVSLEYVFLVENDTSVLFIISQVVAHIMASGCTLVCDPESSDSIVEFEVSTFMVVLVSLDAMLLSIRVHGVHSRFFFVVVPRSRP